MLSDWQKSVFTTDAVDGKPLAHDVYTKGSGPVVLPYLFGPIGRLSFVGNIARIFCMRREFAVFAKQRTSPVVCWLRALATELRNAHKVQGIGVIGMCITGNFAISMMADESG